MPEQRWFHSHLLNSQLFNPQDVKQEFLQFTLEEQCTVSYGFPEDLFLLQGDIGGLDSPSSCLLHRNTAPLLKCVVCHSSQLEVHTILFSKSLKIWLFRKAFMILKILLPKWKTHLGLAVYIFLYLHINYVLLLERYSRSTYKPNK